MPETILCVMAELSNDACATMGIVEQKLKDAGLSGKQTPNLPSHVTLGTFPIFMEKELAARVTAVCSRFKRFTLGFHHLGIFDLNILFFGPDQSKELISLRDLLKEGSHKDRSWVPHATLLIEEPDMILKALPIAAANFSGLEATVTQVSLYAFFPSRKICEVPLI